MFYSEVEFNICRNRYSLTLSMGNSSSPSLSIMKSQSCCWFYFVSQDLISIQYYSYQLTIFLLATGFQESNDVSHTVAINGVPFNSVRSRILQLFIKRNKRMSKVHSPRCEWVDHAEGASTGDMGASGGVLPEGYGHDGPGVCVGDGQTEDEGVPSQGGRGDALLPTPDLLFCLHDRKEIRLFQTIWYSFARCHTKWPTTQFLYLSTRSRHHQAPITTICGLYRRQYMDIEHWTSLHHTTTC